MPKPTLKSIIFSLFLSAFVFVQNNPFATERPHLAFQRDSPVQLGDAAPLNPGTGQGLVLQGAVMQLFHCPSWNSVTDHWCLFFATSVFYSSTVSGCWECRVTLRYPESKASGSSSAEGLLRPNSSLVGQRWSLSLIMFLRKVLGDVRSSENQHGMEGWKRSFTQ